MKKLPREGTKRTSELATLLTLLRFFADLLFLNLCNLRNLRIISRRELETRNAKLKTYDWPARSWLGVDRGDLRQRRERDRHGRVSQSACDDLQRRHARHGADGLAGRRVAVVGRRSYLCRVARDVSARRRRVRHHARRLRPAMGIHLRVDPIRHCAERISGRLNHTYFTLHLPRGFDVPFTRLQLVALGAIGVTVLINCAAVKFSGGVATFLTSIKVLLLIGVGLGAFFYSGGDWSHLTQANVG